MEKDECFCTRNPLGRDADEEIPDRRTVGGRSWCETCGYIFNRDKFREKQKIEMSKIFEPLYVRKPNGL